MKHQRPSHRRALAMLTFMSLSSLLSANQETPNLADTYIPKLEKMLKDNIASFWLDKSLDHDNGGYIINFGSQGQALDGGTKMIVSQARTLWLYSRLIRAGYGGPEYVKAADLGYTFLTEKMWDHEHGGFYWEVDITGAQQRQSRKHLYGQSFALYAISEYYLATKNTAALTFANQCFELLDAKAHDETYGGYIEFFTSDWRPLPEESTPMGSRGDQKLMNTHLHLLEAFTTYYRASRSPLAYKRLQELIVIESNTVFRKSVGASTDRYTRDWTPLPGPVSYGHDIENIWLLMDTCEAVGQSNWLLRDFYTIVGNYALQYGYDETNGGYFDSGSFNEPANRRNKTWWVQAEALVSALYMYRLTEDLKYVSVFKQTYDFIDKHIADWEYGEWHDSVSAEGVPLPRNKAQPWKCGYHNGRAMIECIEILKDLKDR